MSSMMASRWPTLITATVATGDTDEGGYLTDAAVERIVGEARAAYLEGCRTVDASMVTVAPVTGRRGAPVAGDRVTVSAGVVEVFPESFVVEARIRCDREGDIVAEARASVAVRGGVTATIRDELIARAHSARHVH